MITDGLLALLVAVLVALQASGAPERLPASPPIGGPFWTIVVPALLLIVAFGGTLMLYRRFAGSRKI